MSISSKRYKHVVRQKQLLAAIERAQSRLRQGATEYYLSEDDLYTQAIEPALCWIENGIRNRQLYDVPNSTITDWYIFRCAMINYCRYLLKLHRTRWYHFGYLTGTTRRKFFLINLERVIYALENHYIHGVGK